MRRSHLQFLSLVLFSTLLVFPSPSAHLQEREDISDQAKTQLVTQAESLREERPAPVPYAEKKPEIAVEKKEEAIPAERGPVFYLEKIKLAGNTVFSSEDFEPFLAKFEKRENSFHDLSLLAQMISNHYRAKGFLTSRAFVPEQTIEGKSATIEIVEGKIDKIRVEGNRYFKSSLYTDAIRLREDKVFHYQDLEEGLYFLNRKPDRKVKSYLAASEVPEYSTIVIKPEETVPVHFSYEFNNRGTTLTHHARHNLNWAHNNFLGWGDTLSANLSLAEEGAFTGSVFNYRFPIEKTGTEVKLDASYSQSMLVKDLKASEVKGESWSLTPGVTQRIYQSLRMSLDMFLNFEIKDSKTAINDLKSSIDRMRVLVPGFKFNFQDRWGRALLDAALHAGIPNFLGALDNTDVRASRALSGGEFIYYTANLSRIQGLPFSSFMILRGEVQATNDSLASLEQFRLGGGYSVRGYPESDATGDYGFSFSQEVNFPVPFLPKDKSISLLNKKWGDVIRLAGFIDEGKTYLLERGQPTTEKDHLLLGTGFGVRFYLDQYVSVQMDVAFPFGDEGSEPNRVHLSVRVGF